MLILRDLDAGVKLQKAPLLQKRGEMVILVKPQFEVGRDQVGRGGIVRDPELHRAACDRVRAVVETLGFTAALLKWSILERKESQFLSMPAPLSDPNGRHSGQAAQSGSGAHRAGADCLAETERRNDAPG